MPYRPCTAYRAALAAAATPALAVANVTLLTQERVLEAATSFDNQTQTVSAPNFEPFLAAVTAETTFPRAGGGAGTNEAVASINCLVDPNAIKAAGSLAAAGGLAVTGTQPTPVFGEAGALVVVGFHVDVPTLYRLTAAPRPSDEPGDEFELELSNLATDVELFKLTDADPPQSVDVNGTLQPGRYEVQYQVELTGDSALTAVEYGFDFVLSSPCGPSDVGRAGGLEGSDNRLDNNDFVVFIDRFFATAPSADVGSTGATPAPDGTLDNNDFIVFIDQFFSGTAACD